jgi:hypothetical protein
MDDKGSRGPGSHGIRAEAVGKDGKARYTAAYRDLRGSIRSAATFTSERAANQA